MWPHENWVRVLVLAIVFASADRGPSRAQAPKARAPGDALMSFPLFGSAAPAIYRIESIDGASGTVRLSSPGDGPPNQMALFASEGYRLLLHRASRDGAVDKIVRVNVLEIGEDGSMVAQTSPAAAKEIATGFADLVRPFDGSVDLAAQPGDGPQKFVPAPTSKLKALPDILPLGATKPGSGQGPIDSARIAAQRSQSINNLKQIMLALHNFYALNDCFPPAVVYGPDGKPWHSWRVLLLPYLEQGTLYNMYDFSQPWDSPKNKAVSDTVVKVYQDPIYGAVDVPITHYAALVGDNTVFPSSGHKPADASNPMDDLSRSRGASRFASITDGTSNTIAIAGVTPERKIPWAKPEDIAVGPNFPGIGKPGGIGAPYPMAGGAGHLANVAFCDGSVRSIADSINPRVLDALMTRAGGEIIAADAIPGGDSGGARPSVPVLVIKRGADGNLVAVIE